MVKHIVMFRLKEFDSNEEKKEVLNNIKTSLEALID